MESYRARLEELDRKSEEALQQVNERFAKYLESLDLMEEALNIRRDLFGEDSDEYYKTSEKLCELCNMLSMIFLQKEKFDATLEFLKKAEVLGQNSLELKAITFNNMACYYRRIGKLRTALNFLQQALALETKIERSQTLADTHLNICAVYSQLGKHDLAKEHILQSIMLLQEEFLTATMPKKVDNEKSETQSQKDRTEPEAKNLQDRFAVLAIAYHNLGVEYEFLKKFDDAVATYKKGVAFAQKHIGENSQIAQNLIGVLETAQNQINETKNKSIKKKAEKETASNARNANALSKSSKTKPGYATTMKIDYGYEGKNPTKTGSYYNPEPMASDNLKYLNPRNVSHPIDEEKESLSKNESQSKISNSNLLNSREKNDDSVEK